MHVIQELLIKRPRRNRKTESIRKLVQENQLSPSDLIAPLFIQTGEQNSYPIKSLPGQSRLSIDLALLEAQKLHKLGVAALIVFPVIPSEHKDELGSYAYQSSNFLFDLVPLLKKHLPNITLIADIALDPFTSHGHDGLINSFGEVDNDKTLEALCKMSLQYAQAGFDLLAPSDMMDGRIKAIRQSLDANGYPSVGLLSYTAKYASSFYGPFRDALSSAPSFGDKKSYQMNPANSREALLEAQLDEEEGADMLMVKPASLYLDVIHQIRKNTNLPIAAYHVSGEYAMLKAAAQNGWLNFEKTLYETLLSIKRAGADMIVTYGALEMAKWLKSSTEHPSMGPTDKHF